MIGASPLAQSLQAASLIESNENTHRRQSPILIMGTVLSVATLSESGRAERW